MQINTATPHTAGPTGPSGLNGFVNDRLRSMGGALRIAETVLLGSGQQQARSNAWAAVCENRQHALDRAETASVLGARPDQVGALR